ncbi:MAG TPA: hypothetical protein VFA66_16215 [Gaiellaceae bacterium]|nr:hypothetical protein [Gaiellaceae bacterium]
MERRALRLLLVFAALGLGGCGGGSTHSSQPSGTTTVVGPAPTSGTPPLQGEAGSAGTGDIPDNQVFLLFRNRAASYSVKYPEGWAQQGTDDRVVFRDKNNIVRILVHAGRPATAASVGRELGAQPGVKVTRQAQAATISGEPAVKAVYTTESGPSSVTGKRVELTVDRYYLSHAGRVAVLDLGTPVGVDNVDAYRLIVDSFRWR